MSNVTGFTVDHHKYKLINVYLIQLKVQSSLSPSAVFRDSEENI